VVLPWISRTERPVALPNSITEAVLAGKGGTNPAETALAH
jgi:ubiquinol-cytochrome c reductase cytochrome b subunit